MLKHSIISLIQRWENWGQESLLALPILNKNLLTLNLHPDTHTAELYP